MTPPDAPSDAEARLALLWASVSPIRHRAPGAPEGGDLAAADLNDLFRRLAGALDDLETHPESAYFHDTLLGRSPAGREALAELDAAALTQVERDRHEVIQELPYGMVRGWFPVQVQGRLVHCLVSGRFRRPGMKRKELESLAHRAGVAPDELEDVFSRIPSASERHIERSLGLLRALRDTVQTALEERARAQRLSAQLLQSEKTESLGTLSAGLAHHFNNLLSVILGYSSLVLNQENLGEKASQALHKIAEAAQRGRRATEELLAFSQIESEQEIPCRVHDHARSVLAMLAPQQTGPLPLTLRLDAPHDRMQTRPSALHRLVLSLLTLALEPDDGDRQVVLSTANVPGAGPDTEALRVRLTGLPVPAGSSDLPEDLAAQAKALGGRAAWVESSPGHPGLEITLPLAAGAAEPVPVRKDGPPGVRHVQPSDVWVVDDNDTVCEFCAQGLEELGHRPRAVADGEQLMALCDQNPAPPDLFLLDFSLPDYNGLELCEWLRERGIEAPIVLISGLMPNTPDIHEAIQMRKVFFLQKPFTLRELGDLVDLALGDTLLDN